MQADREDDLRHEDMLSHRYVEQEKMYLKINTNLLSRYGLRLPLLIAKNIYNLRPFQICKDILSI
jgi:hypothetical protein